MFFPCSSHANSYKDALDNLSRFFIKPNMCQWFFIHWDKLCSLKQPPHVFFFKKGVLNNFTKFTRIHMCQSFYFNKAASLRPEACNVIKKVTLAQAFSCKFCEISKNRFSYRTTPVAVSVHYNKKTRQCRECQKFYLPNLQIKRNLQYLLAIEMFLKVKYSFDLISIKCNIQRKGVGIGVVLFLIRRK